MNYRNARLANGFLSLENGENIRVKFASFAGLPPIGCAIDVAGFVKSNAFFPQLDNAIWQTNAQIRLPAARGLSNTDIALQYGLAKDSVKHYLSDIFHKLGAANRSEAVAIALRKHLLKI